MIPLTIFLGLFALWLAKQVIGMLVSQQIKGSILDYTTRKARAAARSLPADLAIDYEQDWLAELEALDGKPISALRFAHGLAKASRSISESVDVHCPQREWWLVLTRALDMASGFVLLLAVAPVLSAISLASKLDLPGYPVLYRRPRLGKNGKPIFLFRFRTMAIQVDGTMRRGGVGVFLERTALADLPVLINLLRGDISLVGPPPQPTDPSLPDQRHPSVRPGLASWQRLAESDGVKLTVAEACARDVQRSFRNDMVLLATQWSLTLRGHDLAPTDRNHDGKSDDS